MKKQFIAVLAAAAALAMLVSGCGKEDASAQSSGSGAISPAISSDASGSGSAVDSGAASSREQKQEEPKQEQKQEDQKPKAVPKNDRLMMGGDNYTGLECLTMDDEYENRTYLLEDLTADERTLIAYRCFANEPAVNDAPDFVEAVLEKYGGKNVRDIKIYGPVEVEGATRGFCVAWTNDGPELELRSVAAVVETEFYTYTYELNTTMDNFADLEDEYVEYAGNVRFQPW